MTGPRDRSQEDCEALAPATLDTKVIISTLSSVIEPFEPSAIDENVFSDHKSQKDVKQAYNIFIEHLQAVEIDFMMEAEELENAANEAKRVSEERAFLSISRAKDLEHEIGKIHETINKFQARINSEYDTIILKI